MEYLDEYLLLDATKLTLQQQQSLPTLGGRPGPAPRRVEVNEESSASRVASRSDELGC